MKRNFDVVLKKFDGEALHIQQSQDKGSEVPLTLKHAAIEAVFAQLPGDDKLSGQAKLDLHLLAQRLNNGGEIDLKIEELALLKDRVGKFWPTLFAGPALLELDPPGAE